MSRSRSLVLRTTVSLVAFLAAGSVIAMPFCGNKGYKNNYRYAPAAYAYPPMMPAYPSAPMAPAQMQGWHRAPMPAPVIAYPMPQQASAGTPAPAGK